MAEYVEREKIWPALNAACVPYNRATAKAIEDIPAADVLSRDEAIKMGAELAAMHGSDAASQQFEEAYLKGVEYGMTRRDVRPVVLCKDCMHSVQGKKSLECEKHRYVWNDMNRWAMTMTFAVGV